MSPDNLLGSSTGDEGYPRAAGKIKQKITLFIGGALKVASVI